MVRRNTWITLGVFAAVTLLALILLQSQGAVPVAESTPTPDPLWTIQSAEIAAISVEDLSANQMLRLERHEQGLWRAQSPEEWGADVARIERAASWLSSPSPQAELMEIENLAVYQLDEPHYRVEVLLSNGGRKSFEVGRETPTGGARYVTRPDTEKVWILSLSGLDEVLNLLSDLHTTSTEG